MKITSELLDKMEEYKGHSPISAKEWVPFTKEELLFKIGDREYDDIRVISGNWGTELDVFKGETWLFSILKYGGLFYVRKVNLPYEKYMAYATATRFPFVISGVLIGWFWKHNIERYGWLRTLSIIFVPIFAWWFSGLIPVLIYNINLFFRSTYIVLLFSLYFGVFSAYVFTSIIGFLTGIIFFILVMIAYKERIWVEEKYEAEKEEFDFIDDKLKEFI